MNQVVPQNFKLAFPQARISQQIERISGEISSWASSVLEKSNEQVLAVCVLRGGAFFFTDLLKAIPVSIEPSFCRTWSYSSSNNSQKKGISVSVDDVAADSRSILLVDDICDTGRTLNKLKQVFLELGATEVRSAVLIQREVQTPHFQPDWSGFNFKGEDWFVGYGMEDKNFHANLPDIYTIEL